MSPFRSGTTCVYEYPASITIMHSGRMSDSLLNSPPYGTSAAAGCKQACRPRVRGRGRGWIELAKKLTRAPVVTRKLPFLKDHLVVRLGNVREVKVRLRDEQAGFGRLDLRERELSTAPDGQLTFISLAAKI
jgi:hypothetical protein